MSEISSERFAAVTGSTAIGSTAPTEGEVFDAIGVKIVDREQKRRAAFEAATRTVLHDAPRSDVLEDARARHRSARIPHAVAVRRQFGRELRVTGSVRRAHDFGVRHADQVVDGVGFPERRDGAERTRECVRFVEFAFEHDDPPADEIAARLHAPVREAERSRRRRRCVACAANR